MRSTPTIIAVTVTFNSRAVVSKALESLDDATTDLPCDVVVVDNASTDDTVAACRRANVDLLVNKHNVGYARAINQVLDRVNCYDLVLVFNPDTIFKRDSVKRLVDIIESDPTIGAAGPRLVSPIGNPDACPNGRSDVKFNVFALHAILKRFRPGNRWTRRYHGSATQARDSDWLSGSCLLMRSSAFAGLNGFDESFFLFFEDWDLGRRVRDLGLRNRYEPAAEIYHSPGSSTHPSTQARLLRIWSHIKSAFIFFGRRGHTKAVGSKE